MCYDTSLRNLYGSRIFIEVPSMLAQEALYYASACGQFRTEESCRIVDENCDNYLLFYVLDGIVSVTYEGRTMAAEKGRIGFVDCARLEEWSTDEKTEFLWMHLDGCNMAKIYEHILKLHDGFVFKHKNAREFQYMFKQLLAGYHPERLLSEAEKSRQIYDMLMNLMDGAAAGRGEQPLDLTYESARQFIEENIGKSISLRDIADAVNMSQYHFCRLFKKASGYSPYEYLLMARIDKAKYLLKATNIPIKNVAQQVGYLNASTFSSVFTTKVGLSPKAFRAEAA